MGKKSLYKVMIQ